MSRRDQRAAASSRGREAERPGEIPKAGWKDIALRVKDEMAEDNLSMIAAGVAFYVLLPIFPAIAAHIEDTMSALSGREQNDAIDLLRKLGHRAAAT